MKKFILELLIREAKLLNVLYVLQQNSGLEYLTLHERNHDLVMDLLGFPNKTIEEENLRLELESKFDKIWSVSNILSPLLIENEVDKYVHTLIGKLFT